MFTNKMYVTHVYVYFTILHHFLKIKCVLIYYVQNEYCKIILIVPHTK